MSTPTMSNLFSVSGRKLVMRLLTFALEELERRLWDRIGAHTTEPQSRAGAWLMLMHQSSGIIDRVSRKAEDWGDVAGNEVGI